MTSTGPVTLINVFTVPVEESAPFLDRWRDNAAVMANCPGFRHADMYQAIHDGTELRFVNVAHWNSEQALRAAQASPAFTDSVKALVTDPDLHVTARPAVYQIAQSVTPAGQATETP